MGSIVDGNTVSDAEPSEIHQQRSVVLSVAPLIYDGVKVNLLDTPGYGDFTGELRAGLRAADAALFVVSAVDGVDAATTALWAECAQLDTPRAVVISRLDHPRANFDAALAACQSAFGQSVVPAYLPVRGDGGAAGLLGLLSGQVSEYDGESPAPAVRDATADELAAVESERGTLIEGIISESEDESLMDRYLGGHRRRRPGGRPRDRSLAWIVFPGPANLGRNRTGDHRAVGHADPGVPDTPGACRAGCDGPGRGTGGAAVLRSRRAAGR
jgi:elongation factor G